MSFQLLETIWLILRKNFKCDNVKIILKIINFELTAWNCMTDIVGKMSKMQLLESELVKCWVCARITWLDHINSGTNSAFRELALPAALFLTLSLVRFFHAPRQLVSCRKLKHKVFNELTKKPCTCTWIAHSFILLLLLLFFLYLPKLTGFFEPLLTAHCHTGVEIHRGLRHTYNVKSFLSFLWQLKSEIIILAEWQKVKQNCENKDYV